VVGLLDLMEDRDYAYIVLELCKGPDLEAVLEVRGEPAPPHRPGTRASGLPAVAGRARAGADGGTGRRHGGRFRSARLRQWPTRRSRSSPSATQTIWCTATSSRATSCFCR